MLTLASPPVLTPRDDEKGAFLAAVAALLLVMILLMGYSADSGNLYNARLAAQSAADAAALSGASYLALNENDFDVIDAAIDAQVEEVAAAIVEENLFLRGFTLPQIELNDTTVKRQLNLGEPARSRLSVEVRVELSAPLMLLRFVPGFGETRTVTAVAESDVRPAIISLVLDNSGSMGCPNYDPSSGGPVPDCTCFPACADKKLDFLKTALTDDFIPWLDGVRDILAVTTFNTTATPLVAANPDGGFDEAAIIALVNALTEEGTTNFTDALDTAYEAVVPAMAQQPEFDRVFILFSDGSPTAARLPYVNPQAGLPLSPTPRGNYDYYAWAVEWQNPPDPTKLDGISKLVPAPVDLGTCTDEECPASPPCSTISVTAAGDDDGADELGACLIDLKFRDRDGNIWPTVAAPVDSFRERFMDAAIAIADSMRANRGLVLTVGLGEAPVGVPPYEEPRSEFTRKDNYMRRIALQTSGGIDFPGYYTFAELLAQVDTHQPGEYFPTPSATELPKIFKAIIARIKLQMIR